MIDNMSITTHSVPSNTIFTTNNTVTITNEPIKYRVYGGIPISCLQCINNSENNSESFSWVCSWYFEDINQIVPQKVYEFTFYDGTKVKTIREEEDFFDLEYMFYLALAKKLYSKDYTFEGVLSKSYSLQFEKKYAKAIKRGIKLFNELQKEKAKEEEQEAIKKRQHEKYVRKKKEAKERKRKDQINLIAEAIRLSKEGE